MKLLILPFLLIFHLQAFASTPCKSDDDCALFNTECKELVALSKADLPANASSEKFKRLIVYTWPQASTPTCEKHFFVQPQWPKNPVAKCIKEECTVISLRLKSSGK